MDKCVQRGCSLLSCGSKPPVPPSLPACKIPVSDVGLEGWEIALFVIFVGGGCTVLAAIVYKFKDPLGRWTGSIRDRIYAIWNWLTHNNHTGNSTQTHPAPPRASDSGNVTNQDRVIKDEETRGGDDPDSSTPLTFNHEVDESTC